MASRRGGRDEAWRLYDGMRLQSEANASSRYRLQGLNLPEPVPFNDHLQALDETHFHLSGRPEDLINIAGKRGSLADLNQKLLTIAGVEDGVLLLPPSEESGRCVRLTALVVAPTLEPKEILQALSQRIDAAFLPRPLYKVERLPRNETGKLPRQRLLELLQQLKGSRPA